MSIPPVHQNDVLYGDREISLSSLRSSALSWSSRRKPPDSSHCSMAAYLLQPSEQVSVKNFIQTSELSLRLVSGQPTSHGLTLNHAITQPILNRILSNLKHNLPKTQLTHCRDETQPIPNQTHPNLNQNLVKYILYPNPN